MARPGPNATKEEKRAYRQGIRNPKTKAMPIEKKAIKTNFKDLIRNIKSCSAPDENKTRAIEVSKNMRTRIIRILTGEFDVTE